MGGGRKGSGGGGDVRDEVASRPAGAEGKMHDASLPVSAEIRTS